MTPNHSTRFSVSIKQFISIIAFLCVAVSISTAHAKPISQSPSHPATWTSADAEKLMKEINQALPSEGSPTLPSTGRSGEWFKRFFARCPTLIADWANRAGAHFQDLKRDVVGIIQNLSSLSTTNSASMHIDHTSKTAALSYHMRVPQEIANELGTSTNMKLAEVQVAWYNVRSPQPELQTIPID